MNSSVDGRRFIQYYAPLFDDEGELICVVSESLWLSDLIRSVMKGVLIVEALNALFHLLILLILLHLLNRSIGKPMLMLRNAVVTYADDKDTDNFVTSLIPIGALGNEFGVFSKETASMAVELRRFMDENLALAEEKKRLEGQLAMAVELKHQLMPNVFPAYPDENRMKIYADQVAFKIILSRIASYGLSPSKIMEIVNNRLSRYNEDDLTLSAWFGVYEIPTGRVTAVNAGHECPLIISGNEVREIEEDIPGFIIGLSEGITYRDYSFTLEGGSHLFLYTDGILNATDPSEEPFGYDRMIKDTSDNSADRNDLYGSLRREIGAVQNAVFDFAGDRKLNVDITMLVLGRPDESDPD